MQRDLTLDTGRLVDITFESARYNENILHLVLHDNVGRC